MVSQSHHPSGLWLPPVLPQPPSPLVGAVDLAIARPVPQPDLFLPQSALPQPEDMVICPPTPEELGLPSATLGDVIDLVSELPFEPAMFALSRLAAELHHHPRDRDYHLMLASELYRGQVWPQFKAFVRSSPTHVGFDPRHVAALQRLLVLHAAANPPEDRALTTAEIRYLGGALLGVASALPGGEPPARDPQTPEDWAAWARYTTLIGAWHHETDTVEAFARAHSWYVDVHGDAAFAPKAKPPCDVDAWMLDAHGLTVGEQFAGGLACAVITLALDTEATWRQRLRHIEPGFLRHSALTGRDAGLRR